MIDPRDLRDLIRDVSGILDFADRTMPDATPRRRAAACWFAAHKIIADAYGRPAARELMDRLGKVISGDE